MNERLYTMTRVIPLNHDKNKKILQHSFHHFALHRVISFIEANMSNSPSSTLTAPLKTFPSFLTEFLSHQSDSFSLPSCLVLVSFANFAIGFTAGYIYASRTPSSSEPESPCTTSSSIKITHLLTYPIKACAPQPVTTARITSRGLQHDRLFMVVDFTGRSISQKKYPTMALIRPIILPDGRLQLEAPGMVTYTHAPKTTGEKCIVVAVVTTCEAIDQGDQVAAFFSKFLEVAGLRLVHMRDGFIRKGRGGDFQTSFSDVYPFLLASEDSLAAVSEQVGHDMVMTRFRPNIVVAGAPPFEEDSWKTFNVSGSQFSVASQCVRCKVVTVDPDTGIYDEHNQPTVALKQIRSFGKTVCFGQNVIPSKFSQGSSLSVGDVVTITEKLAEVPKPNPFNNVSEPSPTNKDK